jgi:hypothetical protein
VITRSDYKVLVFCVVFASIFADAASLEAGTADSKPSKKFRLFMPAILAQLSPDFS